MEQTPEPPIRVISTGRVYRPDEHDATHYSMFHQVEGLYVDKQVSMVDLKTTLYQFARAMFGQDAEIDLVPSYFPFTEPSAELYVKMDLGKGPEWMEIGGCGMVDPAVFEHVGYDPEEWTGFAFGSRASNAWPCASTRSKTSAGCSRTMCGFCGSSDHHESTSVLALARKGEVCVKQL